MEKTIVLTLPDDCPEAATHLEQWARGVLAFRKRRAEQFGSDIFPGNAWDLLLHLAIAPPGGLTRSELAMRARCSGEGARLWLKVLVERGLVEEGLDLRYRLTPGGHEGLNAALS